MSKVFAIYKVNGGANWGWDKLIDEYETEDEAKWNLCVLEKHSSCRFYIREQAETHRPWLENADCFCYGDIYD